IFAARSDIPSNDLPKLGYVSHEPSKHERETAEESPLAELMVTVLPDARRKSTDDDDENQNREADPPGARERDAEQIVARIQSLIDDGAAFRQIAILFRAMTGIWPYESALRRANIPYLTVQGKGFYQREEISDL